ncbi:FAD-dependent oxidoreductase [Arthrobacter sp. D2-10]
MTLKESTLDTPKSGPPEAETITVIGGGVIGLSCALLLAQQKRNVKVITAHEVEDTVSSIAAAVWGPVHVEKSDRVRAWALRTREVFEELAVDPKTGIAPQESVAYMRARPKTDRWYESVVQPARELLEDQLPAAYGYGTLSRSLRIDMSRYLPWLRDKCLEAGVVIEHREVSGFDDVPGQGPIVLAAGLNSRTFNGDTESYPIRSQIVMLANTGGLTTSISDRDHPEGMMYVFPRGDTVICGGYPEPHVWNPEYDLAQEARILERAFELAPSLAGAPIERQVVGHRPARPTVRLDREDYGLRPIINCYGHGGAGVTLSWGCAESVSELLASITEKIR